MTPLAKPYPLKDSSMYMCCISLIFQELIDNDDATANEDDADEVDETVGDGNDDDDDDSGVVMLRNQHNLHHPIGMAKVDVFQNAFQHNSVLHVREMDSCVSYSAKHVILQICNFLFFSSKWQCCTH